MGRKKWILFHQFFVKHNNNINRAAVVQFVSALLLNACVNSELEVPSSIPRQGENDDGFSVCKFASIETIALSSFLGINT